MKTTTTIALSMTCGVATRAGISALLMATGAALMSLPAPAAEPFDRGITTGTLYLGSGSALDKTYSVLGAGIGYNVADGLKLGVTGEAWFGNTPSIYKLTPEIRYTFVQVKPVKPYVGAFVTRTFYDGLDDKNSFGARTGIYIPFGSNAALSLGVVYEKISSCDTATYHNCSQWYPELGLLFSF